jgi:large subunit ribosomal protein L6
MSRIAKNPVSLASGINVSISGQQVDVKGPKGNLQLSIHEDVAVMQEDNSLRVAPKNGSKAANALAGTMRALLNNMVMGVSQGFEKKLQLVGVGYRAQMKGSDLNLTLGFSHPVDYSPPAGVSITTPSQTEIIVSGIDKQAVGQVAADIRAYRSPEPYKGKGIRYVDEQIVMKEAKKK